MESYNPSETRNYYILGDSHSEMVQLIETGRDFTKAMGGVLPEQPDEFLSRLHDVLDICCGPGEWSMALAQAYPDTQVTGLDISQGMIEYATALAKASGLDNINFVVGNALDPLPFPDNSFDLVNARQIEGVIPTASWPDLLKEMFRVVRPGGIIRITGNEWGVSSSLGVETFNQLMIRSWHPAGLAHVVDERHYGIVAMLSRYLRDAGCVNVQERASFMDISTGADFHRMAYTICVQSAEIVEPFFLSMNILSKEELERLRLQIATDVSSGDFAGIIYTLTAWGRKPQKY